MDFKQFEYVLMVAREKSFSKAAKKLYISQPSLSQFISRTEENLGVSLFNRGSNPLSLTCEGKIYVEAANKIMNLSKEMYRAFDDIRELKQGVLNIGLTSSKASHPLPVILPEYKKRYPHIKVSITEAFSSELEDMITDGKVDLGIMNMPAASEQIYCEPLMDEKILVAAPPGQTAIKQSQFEAIDINSIKKEQFILLISGMRLRQIVSAAFAEAKIRPNILFETKSIETSLRLAASGLGFTFVPESYALYSGLLKPPEYYVLGEPPLKWTMALAYKKDSYLPKAAKAFIEVTKELFSNDKLLYPS